MEKPEMFHDDELNQEHHHHKTYTIKNEEVEFMIQLPPKYLPLVDLVTGNNNTLREQVFTAFVHHRLTYLSKKPRELIEYVTNIKNVLEAIRVRINAFHGGEEYGITYHEDIIERGGELSQEGEWVEMIVPLPMLLVQCLDDLSKMLGKTREWLANCFIIEEVRVLHADPALIVECWNEQDNFIANLKTRLNAYRELNGRRKENKE